ELDRRVGSRLWRVGYRCGESAASATITTLRAELERVRGELEQARVRLREVKVTEDSDEGPVRISWNGKEWAQASALAEADSELEQSRLLLHEVKAALTEAESELSTVAAERDA